MTETLSSISLYDILLSTDKNRIMIQIDPMKFSIKSKINIQAFRTLTMLNPKRPFIEYLITGLEQVFRFNFLGTRNKKIQNNLKSIELDPASFSNYIQDEVEKGRMCDLILIEQLPCELF